MARGPISGYRHGHRSRALMGTFGRVEITVPRQARQRRRQDNRVEEFGAARLPAANQASRFADCRRLSCRDQYASSAPGALGRLRRRDQQEPALAKAGDTVSRGWRKVKGDWDAWNARP